MGRRAGRREGVKKGERVEGRGSEGSRKERTEKGGRE